MPNDAATIDEMKQETGNEELWSHVFGVGAADLLDQRTFHARLPSDPRCRLCRAPFGGFGGFFLRFRGKARAKRNPHYCNACDTFLENHPGGAEVPMAILYADIRGSTEFARDQSPAQVSQRINRFLEMATKAINDRDGFLLAFYGDCVFANWPPGFSGEDFAAKAVDAALELKESSKTADIPVGIGVHVGRAYMCSIQANRGAFRDVSVFGEAVNLTARLSDAARGGEIVLSREAAEADGRNGDEEMLTLKGFDEPVAALRL